MKAAFFFSVDKFVFASCHILVYCSYLNFSYTGDIDLSSSQREWANEIMTWVFHNKLLYTGPNALEQFCNALLLNLQNYGNPPPTSLGSPSTNILVRMLNVHVFYLNKRF